MTYDDNISETVSLSKILDCFIEEEESPSTIINFLKEHESDILDILDCSEYSERIFFLDFISKCSYKESIEILHIIKKLYGCSRNSNSTWETNSLYLVWQILQSNISECIKNTFRPYLTLVKPPRHPYAGCSRGFPIMAFDNLFKNIEDDVYTIAENINRIKDETFDTICFSLENSLFKNRIFQKDIFLLLDYKKQFMLLNEIKIRGVKPYHFNFFRQILNSPVDVEIKYFIYCLFDNKRNARFKITKELLDLIDGSVNIPQLMLKLNLYGIENFGGELLFYLLYNRKTDWLVELMECDIDLFKENFDICDLIERLTKNGNNS